MNTVVFNVMHHKSHCTCVHTLISCMDVNGMYTYLKFIMQVHYDHHNYYLMHCIGSVLLEVHVDNHGHLQIDTLQQTMLPEDR